jgi:HEAT repeat protein
MVAVVCAADASAQVRVTNGGGKTVQDLVGADTFVTVWLHSGALDRNMRVRIIGEDYLGLNDTNGQPHAYKFRDIRELRVQSGVEADGGGGAGAPIGRLSSDDRGVEERAIARAFELFDKNKDNQQLLMRAAAVMAATNGPNKQNAAGFLSQRAGANDVPTAVAASLALYIAGFDPEAEVIGAGLYSGVRRTKAEAALLAGLTGNREFDGEIYTMLDDPAPEIFSGAAIGAALLDDRDAVPRLVDALKGLDDRKGDAAVIALSTLGGDDVRAEMKKIAEEGRGMARFRALRVLFALGDAGAAETLKPENLKEPALEVDAAILLCRNGDWDANIRLREELDRPKDPNKENLVQRAKIATALYIGGHIPAKGTLQDLLRMTKDQVYARGKESDDAYKQEAIIAAQVEVCRQIARSGVRALMSLLRPALESAYPEVATAAVESSVAMANQGYRERLLAVRQAP